MKMYRDSSGGGIIERVNRRIFWGPPLGRPGFRYEETVSSFTKENLLDYMSERYRPDNLLVAVAGNVNHDEVAALAKEWLNQPESSVTENKEQPLLPYKQFRSEITKSIEQTHMIT